MLLKQENLVNVGILDIGSFKASYCTNCKKFRKVHCYLKSNPICIDCTRLKAIEVVEPIIIEEPEKPKKKEFSPVSNTQALKNLRDRLIVVLDQNIATSRILYENYFFRDYSDSKKLTHQLRKLVEQGFLVSRFDYKKQKYYALSGYSNLLEAVPQKSEHDKFGIVLKSLLENKFLSLVEIIQHFRSSINPSTLRNKLQKAEREGYIKSKRGDNVKYYVLTGNENLFPRNVNQQVKTKDCILKALSDGAKTSVELAKIACTTQRTIQTAIYNLRAKGLIKTELIPSFSGGKRTLCKLVE